MKYIFFIIGITSLFSCGKEINDCKNAELENRIIIANWGTDTIKSSDIILYTYDSLFAKKIDSFEIQKVVVYNDKNAERDYFGDMEIVFEKPLFSENNYRLILLDSLKYDISDIEIYEETVMMGTKEKKQCLVNDFKVNGLVVRNNTMDAKIVFKK